MKFKQTLPFPHRLVLSLYDGLWRIVLACWSLYVILRRRTGWRRDLAERLGWSPSRPEGASLSIWIHAVSVGEFVSIIPVIAAVKRRDPKAWVMVTVSNDRAFEMALRRPSGADAICRTPWDAKGCVDRALRRASPDVLAIVECEIWPNMILRASAFGARVVMLNARVYERDFARYRAARKLFSPILTRIDSIHVQSVGDRERFLALGVDERQVHAGGNTKFDVSAPANTGEVLAALARLLPVGRGPIWVLASTHADEESRILAEARPLFDHHPSLRIVVAPRDVSRGREIAAAARAMGYRVQQRSVPRVPADCEVLVLDSLGELAAVMSAADVVFVGGSLVDKGGHNPIEPALFAKPILLGPSVYNFSDVVETFTRSNAVRVVKDAAELCQCADQFLNDPARGRAMGLRAAQVVEENRGAADRYAANLISRPADRAAA